MACHCGAIVSFWTFLLFYGLGSCNLFYNRMVQNHNQLTLLRIRTTPRVEVSTADLLLTLMISASAPKATQPAKHNFVPRLYSEYWQSMVGAGTYLIARYF
jgi:hypothetical protein